MNGKDDERYKILKAFSESRYIYRSLGGLSKETGISKENVQMILNILINHELVEQANRPKGVRFLITQKGRQIIFN
ncbi:hypothetical protein PGLA_03095 [Paenibacillus glacialis]|uniref:HTH marR-type domain-containing protein n=2 Tax=Paenibacillus glacialis TaxID=494026 RepID=A0A168N0Q5_9BACL|nr:hypothetical protein PGLA_03095 [Paenibacillus glacialis]